MLTHARRGTERLTYLALSLIVAGLGACAQPVIGDPDMKQTPQPENTAKPTEFNSMRPVRAMHTVTISVGQGQGDLQGKDDKVIQAAVDYVANLGGGTVQVLPGVYELRNSIHMRPHVTLRGSGEQTILRKNASFTTQVSRETDWFEYAVKVADPSGFTPGCGILVVTEAKGWPNTYVYNVTAIKDNFLYLDRRTEKNFFMSDKARVQTLFSLVRGERVDDVRVEDLVLDGNKAQNDNLETNYGGAIFAQYCDRWELKNVIARDFNGDGFSFQVCNDLRMTDCQALNNVDLGIHPGSGSQRPVFKNCVAKGNLIGLFWCWGVCDGVAEDCTLSDNRRSGASFGHRDTDNVMRNCLLERNAEAGIIFRKEDNEYRPGDRNRIEACTLRDNGGTIDCGIDLQWKISDITITKCRFENSEGGKQKTGIRISPEARRITMSDNTFVNCETQVLDQRATGAKADETRK